VETGVGSNLRARLSTALAMSIEGSQTEMTEKMAALLPGEKRLDPSGILPRREPFQVLYRLNCDNLCGDFKEDVSFKFSFGIQAIMKRIQGRNQYGFFGGSVCSSSAQQGPRGLPPLPNHPLTPLTPSNEAVPQLLTTADEWAAASRIALAAVASQGTVGGLLLAGFLLKTVGWRVIVVSGVIYGGLYLYERLTWTNKAMEREFKKQYVEHITRKLRMIVDITSANCSHQVQQELSSTFGRLCHLVDSTTNEMEHEMKRLDLEIFNLEELSGSAKILKNEANELINKLAIFDKQYLQERSAP